MFRERANPFRETDPLESNGRGTLLTEPSHDSYRLIPRPLAPCCLAILGGDRFLGIGEPPRRQETNDGFVDQSVGADVRAVRGERRRYLEHHPGPRDLV